MGKRDERKDIFYKSQSLINHCSSIEIRVLGGFKKALNNILSLGRFKKKIEINC